MPFDSNGTFNRLYSWKGHAAAGTKIRADYHDNEDDGLAAGLSNCITKDGSTQPLADIPMNGHKIINHGNVTGSDAASTVATKGYVDNFKSFGTGINVDGAGPINGFITFNAPTGVNGIGWNTADMSWIGRDAVAAQSNKRLAVNDKIDGTGNDVCTVDIEGRINCNAISSNMAYDGATWRNIAAGKGLLMGHSGQSGIFSLQTNDTATTVAYQAVVPRTFFSVSDASNGTFLTLDKEKSGEYCRITASMGTKARWVMDLGNATAETGGTTGRGGSDYYLYSYANDGSGAFAELAISRSTHAATFGGAVNADAFAATGTGTFTGGVLGGAGYRCHNGVNIGGYSTDWFNMLYVSGMHIFVNNSDLGVINTTSDYRTKKSIAPLASTWDKVKALRPVSFKRRDYVVDGTYISKDSDDVEWGFVAHELQEDLVPSAANGLKDQEYVVQSPNPLAVIAALTKALQEAMARIEALEAAA